MTLFDFECQFCGLIFEKLVDRDTEVVGCQKCLGKAKKIISIGRINTANDDTPWIRTVTEVVDKDGGQHCQEFLKSPTRTNYQNWMKGEGLRPFEPGEKPKKPHVPTKEEMRVATLKKHQETKRIEVRS